MDLSDLRKDYNLDTLELEDALPNGIDQFKRWMEVAVKSNEIEPNAVVLSTVDHKNHPDARTILLKGIENEKLSFYTNYNSVKGKQIEDNQSGHLLFMWLTLHRQVRIKGTIVKMTKEQSQGYYNSRPRGSQIGAWSSPQSEVISDRKILEKQVEFYAKKFENTKKIPIPEFWGGYYLIPHELEFWQGRTSRLHDRLRYQLNTTDNSWTIERLAP
jgi:pyridoxamine 5'-phosphate oxidase